MTGMYKDAMFSARMLPTSSISLSSTEKLGAYPAGLVQFAVKT